jgi:hypothetical protein
LTGVVARRLQRVTKRFHNHLQGQPGDGDVLGIGYHRTDGSTARLAGRPTVWDSDGAPDWDRDPVVVSLARWDRIKDPFGILDGFLERVRPAAGAHLLLAGPRPGPRRR